MIVDCLFIGNSAVQGGGLGNSFAITTLINCLFIGNTASLIGGGTFDEYGITTMTNCTFSGNTSDCGGGILFQHSITMTNCILWGNADDGGSDESGQLTGNDGIVTYSCIQGLDSFAGNGNMGDNPLFIDPNGPDGVPGTQDDDLRLGPGSPCIDAADNESVPADEFDLDGDGDTTEPMPLDLDGRLRFVDDPATDDTGNGPSPVVDMGPYEFQIEDSPCDGDANGDGVVDPLDSGFVLARFGCPVGDGDPDCDAADQNGDGLVDPLDSGYVLARFGPCP